MRILLAGLLLVFSLNAASAESFAAPRITSFKPDWDAAFRALPVIPPQTPDALAALTAIASDLFPAVATSPVPVLLPFPIADYAHDRAADSAQPKERYSDFQPTRFFLAGPTGYDATFSILTRDVPDLDDIGFTDPVVVQISAFNTVYELPPAKGAIVSPSGEMEKQFPGLTRQILESTLRYSFTRFDIPYVVSIQCFDGPQRRTRLSCRNADRIAARFMRALRLAGGKPDPAESNAVAATPERPEAVSDSFTYHRVGALLAGTAMRSPTGDADPRVYARIRFPLGSTPAFVNSQSFMHGGDCSQTGRRSATGGYRCRVNDKPLRRDEAAAENYAYPWRDNFCENRHFFVGQCMSGLGHQGQDIRPATCETKATNNARCQPYLHNVVAVRDGMILREPWNDSFFLVTNAPGERLRFRHLHMHPRKLDNDGIASGHIVKEGDVIGTVGNYNRRPGWTTTHLHFEVQVPTRDGWVRVNPYMTLVAAYEHLIGARGTEIEEPAAEEPVQTEKSESGENRTIALPVVRPIMAKATTSSAGKPKAGQTNFKKIKAQRSRTGGRPLKSRGKVRR